MGDAPARFAGMVGRGSFLALAALVPARRDQGDAAGGRGATSSAPRASTPGTCPPASTSPTPCSPPTTPSPQAVLAQPRASGNEELTWWLFLGTAFYERGHAEIAEGLFRRALARGAAAPGARASASSRPCSPSAATPRSRTTRASCRSARSPFARAAALARRRRPLPPATTPRPRPPPRCSARRRETTPRPPSSAPPRASDHAAPAPSPLAIDAAPDAVHMLDALARLEEYELFERLVPPWPGRRRRRPRRPSTLGELFLARGFYRARRRRRARGDRGGRDGAAGAGLPRQGRHRGGAVRGRAAGAAGRARARPGAARGADAAARRRAALGRVGTHYAAGRATVRPPPAARRPLLAPATAAAHGGTGMPGGDRDPGRGGRDHPAVARARRRGDRQRLRAAPPAAGRCGRDREPAAGAAAAPARRDADLARAPAAPPGARRQARRSASR